MPDRSTDMCTVMASYWQRIGSTWRFVVCYFVAFTVLKSILNSVVDSMDQTEESTIHTKRVVGVFKYECLMLIADIFVYSRVRDLFQRRTSPKLDPRAARRLKMCQRISRLSALLVIALSHSVFLVYWNAPMWPTTFVWCAAMGHGPCSSLSPSCYSNPGLYLHLVAIFLGAWLAHQMVLQLYARICRLRSTIERWAWLLLDTHLHTGIAICIALALCIVQWVNVYAYEITDVHIGLPNHNRPPLRIAVLSDIHMGGVIGKEQLQTIVQTTNEAKPDVIVIVGDLMDGSVSGIGDRMSPLHHLHARHGIFYVSGNHEFYYGSYVEWSRVLRREYKIDVLDNDVRRPVKGLCLVGLDERVDEVDGLIESSIWKSSRTCNSSDHLIVLAHNPRIAKYITHKMQPSIRELVHLVVSGHVHAGQFYIVAPLMRMLAPYFYGHYEAYESSQTSYSTYRPHVYVSAGVHFWAVPMKMVGFAEITMLHIHPK